MRILVFDSTTQLNAHIIYASLLVISHILIGMELVLVSVMYGNGVENEHTPWNFKHQNKHSVTAVLGFQFLLCLGIMAHNRTDGWSSSLQNYMRLFLHVTLNICALGVYWISLRDSVEMTGGRDNTCGRSAHCRSGWVSMYIAALAFFLGPLAAIFDHVCSVVHSVAGMLTICWAAMTIINGIQKDIYHRSRFLVLKTRQEEELGQFGIALVYVYTTIQLIYPTLKIIHFILRIRDDIKVWTGVSKAQPVQGKTVRAKPKPKPKGKR